MTQPEKGKSPYRKYGKSPYRYSEEHQRWHRAVRENDHAAMNAAHSAWLKKFDRRPAVISEAA